MQIAARRSAVEMAAPGANGGGSIGTATLGIGSSAEGGGGGGGDDGGGGGSGSSSVSVPSTGVSGAHIGRFNCERRGFG